MKQPKKAMKQLNHPNLVRLLGYDPKVRIRGKYCMAIVEEFCAKGDLFDYIAKTGRFQPAFAMKIFQQLCTGLKHMHDAGVAHRDLKAENLLFDKNFDLKICDFGFAKKFLDHHGRKRGMQTIVGTPSYIAPEVWEQKRLYTEKVDVFAAGIILFDLLAAKMPFQLAKNSDRSASKLKNKQYDLFWKIHEKGMKFEEGAKKLIQSMLNFSSRRRLNIDRVLDHDYMKCADRKTKEEFQSEMNRRVEFMTNPAKPKEEKSK